MPSEVLLKSDLNMKVGGNLHRFSKVFRTAFLRTPRKECLVRMLIEWCNVTSAKTFKIGDLSEEST